MVAWKGYDDLTLLLKPTCCSWSTSNTHTATCSEFPGRSCCVEPLPARPAPLLVSACRSPPGHTTSCSHSVDAPLSPCRRNTMMRGEEQQGVKGRREDSDEKRKWRTDEMGQRVAETKRSVELTEPCMRQRPGQMCSAAMCRYFRGQLRIQVLKINFCG